MSNLHHSVLLQEVIEGFSPLKIHNFLDCTLGAAGHSEAILQSHPEIVQLYGIDQDPLALEIARTRLTPFTDKVTFLRGNFAEVVQTHKFPPLQGILMDLGVSSMQLDRPEKGFSFMKDGPLDMRMDPDGLLTAEGIVNEWDEREIMQILWKYGEEPQGRKIAQAIVRARNLKPIRTTKELSDVISSVKKQRKEIHPATLTFQALRIAVNRELEVLEQVLPRLVDLLAAGGRLAVISFHSLEDRIVKNFFRYLASDKENTNGIGGIFLDKEPLAHIITRKAILPTDTEAKMFPRSRSAKLRVIQKI